MNLELLSSNVKKKTLIFFFVNNFNFKSKISQVRLIVRLILIGLFFFSNMPNSALFNH